MTVSFKAIAFGAMLMGLSACVANDPAAQQEKSDRMRKASANALATAKAELPPLVPLCLRAVTGGAAPSEAELAKLGFSKSILGYTKPRGSRTIDRINMQNTTFSANANRCTMGLGNYLGVQEAGAAVREVLGARGYKRVGQTRAGFVYSNGAKKIVLNGFASGTVTSITLSKG